MDMIISEVSHLRPVLFVIVAGLLCALWTKLIRAVLRGQKQLRGLSAWVERNAVVKVGMPILIGGVHALLTPVGMYHWFDIELDTGLDGQWLRVAIGATAGVISAIVYRLFRDWQKRGSGNWIGRAVNRIAGKYDGEDPHEE